MSSTDDRMFSQSCLGYKSFDCIQQLNVAQIEAVLEYHWSLQLDCDDVQLELY